MFFGGSGIICSSVQDSEIALYKCMPVERGGGKKGDGWTLTKLD